MDRCNIDRLRAEQAEIRRAREQSRKKLEFARDIAVLLLAVLSFGVLLGTAGGLEHGQISLLCAAIVMGVAMVVLWIASENVR